MTQYDWNALLVAVARKIGWRVMYYDGSLDSSGQPVCKPAKLKHFKFPLSPDSLDDVAALMERGKIRGCDWSWDEENEFYLCHVRLWAVDGNKYAAAEDKLPHSLIVATAKALGINVAEFAKGEGE